MSRNDHLTLTGRDNGVDIPHALAFELKINSSFLSVRPVYLKNVVLVFITRTANADPVWTGIKGVLDEQIF